eukprot:Skav231022  [mRNA]  locus=scaffold1869:109285:118232:+ [translate_table: standard]
MVQLVPKEFRLPRLQPALQRQCLRQCWLQNLSLPERMLLGPHGPNPSPSLNFSPLEARQEVTNPQVLRANWQLSPQQLSAVQQLPSPPLGFQKDAFWAKPFLLLKRPGTTNVKLQMLAKLSDLLVRLLLGTL